MLRGFDNNVVCGVKGVVVELSILNLRRQIILTTEWNENNCSILLLVFINQYFLVFIAIYQSTSYCQWSTGKELHQCISVCLSPERIAVVITCCIDYVIIGVVITSFFVNVLPPVIIKQREQ